MRKNTSIWKYVYTHFHKFRFYKQFHSSFESELKKIRFKTLIHNIITHHHEILSWLGLSDNFFIVLCVMNPQNYLRVKIFYLMLNNKSAWAENISKQKFDDWKSEKKTNKYMNFSEHISCDKPSINHSFHAVRSARGWAGILWLWVK